MDETPLAKHLMPEGVEMMDVRGVAVPRRFEGLAEEIAAAREGAALVDLGWVAHLVATGRHRARFVHNMTTCEVKKLEAGQGAFGMVVDGGGKVVAQLVVDAEPERLVMELARDRVEAVKGQLERFRVADDVKFAVEADRTVMTLVGPQAEAVLGAAMGPPGIARDFDWQDTHLGGVAVRVRRNPRRLVGVAWDVTTARQDAPAAWQALREHGAAPIGFEAWEALRVVEGVPADGVDIGEANSPLESGWLYATVNWDKGCYIGQEVIAMTHYRGRPNKHLRGLELPEGELPAPGTALTTAEGKDAGVVGTAVRTPERAAPVALAVLKRKQAEPGTALRLPDGRAVVVTALPVADKPGE